MSYFPSFEPVPEPIEPPHDPRIQPPHECLPAMLPVTTVVATTVHAGILLMGISVYPDGLEFQIERRLRRIDLDLDVWDELTRRFVDHWPRSDADRLRYGVTLADGTRVLEAMPFEQDNQATSLTRNGGAGGGGQRSYTMRDTLWLWPRPPGDGLALVMQWPTLDIPETHVPIDLGDVERIARRSRRIWDDATETD